MTRTCPRVNAQYFEELESLATNRIVEDSLGREVVPYLTHIFSERNSTVSLRSWERLSLVT
jgi:hypothetical protein